MPNIEFGFRCKARGDHSDGAKLGSRALELRCGLLSCSLQVRSAHRRAPSEKDRCDESANPEVVIRFHQHLLATSQLSNGCASTVSRCWQRKRFVLRGCQNKVGSETAKRTWHPAFEVPKRLGRSRSKKWEGFLNAEF